MKLLTEGGAFGSYQLSLETSKNVVNWMTSKGIVSQTPQLELHVTTTFSTDDVVLQPAQKPIRISQKSYSIAVYEVALVLEFQSTELQKVHDNARASGASYSYPSYKPHMTLSYDAAANQKFLENPTTPTFDLLLTHEVIKPFNPKYLKVKEDTTTTAIDLYPTPLSSPIRRKVSDSIYKEILVQRKHQRWNKIAESYHLEDIIGRHPIILENEKTLEWVFLKYGLIAY